MSEALKKILIYKRQTLKDLLCKCTIEQTDKFKRMYSFDNQSLNINDIVDNMEENVLPHCILQAERTIEQNEIKLHIIKK